MHTSHHSKMIWERKGEGWIGSLVAEAKILINIYISLYAVNVYVKVIHAYCRTFGNYTQIVCECA